MNPNEGSLADSGRIPRTITMLLRAGASLDAVSDDKTAEEKILRLRSLVARGRATPKKWSPRGHDRRAIEFLVKIGDNGIAWKILSFWKET